ncbi:DUF1715-domain-containing protein, partial [Piedraia hortae CBS 480.64]
DTMDDDPFDSILTLESQFYAEGHAEGMADGARSGKIEGRIVGLEKSFEKGLQMGCLAGQAAVWRAQLESNSAQLNCLSQRQRKRMQKHVNHLSELTDSSTLRKENIPNAVTDFDNRLASAVIKQDTIMKILRQD